MKTYRSDGDVRVLEPVWNLGLDGLTEVQLRRGLERIVKEHLSGFMPTPGVFRTLALDADQETGLELRNVHIAKKVVFAKDAEDRDIVTELEFPHQAESRPSAPALPSPAMAKGIFANLEKRGVKPPVRVDPHAGRFLEKTLGEKE